MTFYVRAKGPLRFTDHGRVATFARGELVPEDHWAVVGCTDRARKFETVPETDPDALAADDRKRADLAARLERGEYGTEGVAAQREADQRLLNPSAHRSDTSPGNRTRALARRQIESLFRSGALPGYAAERVELLVSRSGGLRDQNAAASWVLAAGDPAYRTAFAKLLADPDRGHMLWTDEEQRAYSRVREYRAMSLTATSGEELVPLTLDPTIMLTSDGTTNALRGIARVVQTSTDSWKGVSSAGATAEWLPENGEAADGSPTLAQPEVPVHKHSVFVPYSFEVGMDAMDFLTQLGIVMSDALAALQADAFVTGDGVNKPEGFLTGATQTVASATANAFGLDDVYAVQEALPPRFQGNATWAAPLGTLNALAQFETTNGAPALPMTDGRLLRKPIAEVSDMSATFVTGGKPLAYGDWKAGYVIADRIGSTVELIPNLMGANRRPTGQRGVFLWARTGGKVVVPQALRVLAIG